MCWKGLGSFALILSVRVRMIMWAYHLAKWQNIAKPKVEGGWGLNNIHHFGKSLDAKILWIFITKNRLWTRIIMQIYIATMTLLD